MTVRQKYAHRYPMWYWDLVNARQLRCAIWTLQHWPTRSRDRHELACPRGDEHAAHDWTGRAFWGSPPLRCPGREA